MSAGKDNGGPAFPAPELGFKDFGDTGAYPGMTLRDYFAAKALPAEILRWKDGHPKGFSGIAAGAYMAADAMLKAREA